jgi:ActR/RegA family two-component response regulator
VRSLLISRDEEYQAEWRRIFNSRGWDLEYAPTLDDALHALCARPVPLVVYDLQAADEDWREILAVLWALPHHPCVLLASSVIDEGFRDEVVQLHGYDVLSRHADEDEIGRTINSAWFWKHRHA